MSTETKTTLGSLLVAGLFLAPAAAQEPIREPLEEARLLPGLHPSLEQPLREIVEAHLELIELRLLLTRDPEQAREAWKERFEEWLRSVPRPVVERLARGTVAAETLQDLWLGAVGHEAFGRGWVAAPSLGPEDLLEALDPVVLEVDPRKLPEVERWLESHQREVRGELTAALASLEVGGASIRYLLFGALHTPGFWWRAAQSAGTADAAREAFLTQLLERGASSESSAFVVEAALRAPSSFSLMVAGNTAVGMAGERIEDRGPVGFRERHLAQVEEFLREVSGFRGGLADDPFAKLTWSEGRVEVNPAGYLPRWAARMHRRIFRELHPESPWLGRYGTLAEQQSYWRSLAERVGWGEFRLEMRPALERMLQGEWPHPLDERIAELEGRLEWLTPGSAEQEKVAAELRRLTLRRSSDQERVMEGILSLFVELAPGDEGWVELERFGERAETLGLGWRARVAQGAWFTASLKAPQRSVESLRRKLDGEAVRLPQQAQVGAVLVVKGGFAGDQRELLVEMGLSDDPGLRWESLISLDLVEGGDARRVVDRALADVRAVLGEDPGARLDAAGRRSRNRLLAGVLHGLHGRALKSGASEPWAIETLVRTFDDGGVNLWAGEPDFVGGGDDPLLRWVAATLPEADFLALEAAGRIPEAIVRLRLR